MIRNPFTKEKIPSEGAQWLPLLKQHGYSDAAAAAAAPKLEHMNPQLREELLHWDRTGNFSDHDIEGFSAAGLVENVGMHPVGAFLMMDWLLREPDEAKYALAQPYTKLVISQEAVRKIEESDKSDIMDAPDIITKLE